MLLQPRTDTLAVKPVGAGQDGDLVADFDVVHADGAFGFAVGAHHALVDFFFRERRDRGCGSGTWGCGAVLGFHELGDYAVKGFFGVYGVSVGGVGGIEELGEDVEGWGEGGVSGTGATVLVHAVHVLQERAEEPVSS